VALSAVQKAITSGRISTLADGRIDSGVADGEWAANTKARPPAVRRQPEQDDQDSFGAAQYSKARAVREHYQARLAKIEYEERVGSLVSKDEVQVAAFNTHRVIRDAMLNIPDRIAAMLAAETDEAKCYEILATEIRKALNEFADANA
jgi:formaldehyde-activating enzyme involved in methanogenesis